jgi:hypothetical protein
MTPVGKTPETGAGPYGMILASVSYSSGVQERCPVRVFKEAKWSLSHTSTYNTSERGIAYGARVLWRQSARISRGSHDPPKEDGKAVCRAKGHR